MTKSYWKNGRKTRTKITGGITEGVPFELLKIFGRISIQKDQGIPWELISGILVRISSGHPGADIHGSMSKEISGGIPRETVREALEGTVVQFLKRNLGQFIKKCPMFYKNPF